MGTLHVLNKLIVIATQQNVVGGNGVGVGVGVWLVEQCSTSIFLISTILLPVGKQVNTFSHNWIS